MRETIELEATPYDEECAQVGSPDYHERARREANAYRHQLMRLLIERNQGRPLPDCLHLRVRSHGYHEVIEVHVTYDNEDEVAADLAWWLENDGAPAKWDAAALDELGICRQPAEVACLVAASA